MSSSTAARSIPRYRSAALSSRLPPAKLPLFRSVVSHPPAPFAVEAAQRAAAAAQAQAEAEDKGNGKASPSPRPLVGPHQFLYSTAPRPLIPLTTSPTNHKLWNPPSINSKESRSIEKDESGRLSRFAARFGGASAGSGGEEVGEKKAGSAGEGGKKDDELFSLEGDLSWLDGITAQSKGGALGKKDIVGAPKSVKKGKK